MEQYEIDEIVEEIYQHLFDVCDGYVDGDDITDDLEAIAADLRKLSSKFENTNLWPV